MKSKLNSIVTFLLLFSLQSNLFAQVSISEQYIPDVEISGEAEITLDRSISINHKHPYIDFFEEQDPAYIRTLYGINKGRSISTKEYGKPAQIVRHSKGNNSLIFTITKGDQIKFDTLRNTVHPEYKIVKQNEGWGFFGLRKWFAGRRAQFAMKEQNLQGSLPKGCVSYISRSSKGIEFGVQVAEPRSHVKMEIANIDGEILTTLVDDYQLRGWSNYKWKKGNHKGKMFQLNITVDGQLMTQNFKTR